ncbi:MAG: O-antigen ligase family protein, partial [Bacteroidota bacterium]
MKSIEKLFSLLFLTQLASIVYSIALAQLLYFVLLIIWIVIIVNEKQWTLNGYDALFGAFVLLRITAIIFSEYPSASSTAFLREIIFYPYYFIAVYFLRTQRTAGLRKIMEVLLYAAVIPSLYAIGTVLTHAVERGASFSGGYSVFAVHGAFTIAFGLLLVLDEHRQKQKIVYLSVIALVAGAVLVTYTRAMWISVILSFIFIGLAGYKKLLAGLAAAGIAVVAFSASLQERFLSLLDPVHNSSGRLELWSAGMKLVPAHFFFGFGPETFGSIVGDRSRFPDHYINSWHNEFLHVCIESGIF